MEIFEKIGDAASKTYKFTAEKTSKLAKETKLRMQINESKRKIEDLYKEIGEEVYQKSILDEDIKKEDLKEKCDEIDELSDKIVNCKNEILTLKEKRQCKNCYEEIEITAHFCPNCGFEQPEIEKCNCNDESKEECNCEQESKEDKEQGKVKDKKEQESMNTEDEEDNAQAEDDDDE